MGSSSLLAALNFKKLRATADLRTEKLKRNCLAREMAWRRGLASHLMPESQINLPVQSCLLSSCQNLDVQWVSHEWYYFVLGHKE